MKSDKEFVHFLHIGLGSCSELETRLEIARRLKMADLNHLSALERTNDSVRKMTFGLIQFLLNRKNNG